MSDSSSESYDDLHGAGATSTLGETWDADHEWEMASNGTADHTGPGPDNLVPHGCIGAEYRTMKANAAQEIAVPRGDTPHRDPYHGRTTDPK